MREHIDLPEEARDALLGPDARARSQAFNNAFVVFVGDFHRDFSADPEAFGALRIYVSPLGQLRPLLARLRRYASANRTALAHLPERIAGWSAPQRSHQPQPVRPLHS